MRKKITSVTALCCVLVLVMAGCSGQPPNPTVLLKEAISSSATSTVSLQFTNKSGYLGSIQMTGKTAVKGEQSRSSYDISVAGANNGMLECTAYSDSATGKTVIEAPDALKQAIVSKASLADASAVAFSGADALEINAVAQTLIAWINTNRSKAAFSKTTSNPFSQDGVYSWKITAADAAQIMAPAAGAMQKSVGKDIVQTVDNGFAAAFKQAVAAGGKTYDLQVSVQSGAVRSIALESDGFVSASDLQSSTDPWTGKVDTGKTVDGMNLSVQLASKNLSIADIQIPQNAVAAE